MNMLQQQTNLLRSIIGSDHLEKILSQAMSTSSSGYPPFNIERLGEDSFKIEIAVAGFSEDELSVVVERNRLSVEAKPELPKEGDKRNYIHQGIARRPFKQTFAISDYVKVDGASIENGLLVISLKNEIPEEEKPKQIEIIRK